MHFIAIIQISYNGIEYLFIWALSHFYKKKIFSSYNLYGWLSDKNDSDCTNSTTSFGLNTS